MSDCCLTPTEQFLLSYIMARTSTFSIRL